jgi:superfamily II DNA or RNA helicase
MKSPEKLQLFSYQKEHVKNIKNKLKKHGFCLDTSPLGTGKTFVSAYLAQEYTNVVVISTKTILLKWKKIREIYDIKPIKNLVSFNNIKKTFESTKVKNDLKREYKNMKGDVLFIIDESQNLKNNSTQTKWMVKIVKENKSAHFLYISGSPFDKPQHSKNYLKLFGIVEPNRQAVEYNPLTGRYMFHMYNDLLTYLRNTRTRVPEELKTVNGLNWEVQLFELFKDYLVPYISVKMEASKEYKLNTYKIFVNVDLEVLENLKEKHITTKLMEMEALKVPEMVRDAHKALAKGKKVVLLANFMKNINTLMDELYEYTPMQITGKTPMDERENILLEFQRNDDNLRLIIGNLTVLSTGIDLDDKTGDFPRMALVSPNLNGVTLYQAMNRFSRIDTRSDTDVYFYYISYEDLQDFDYLDLIQDKNDTIMDILKEKDLLLVFKTKQRTGTRSRNKTPVKRTL